ncbi:MAG: hypothetical protein HN380_34620, partial [Victivallales bacterium]|nr:hypothetical protein [Victivallales bacterium]
ASGLFGPSALALSIETVLSETTVAASLSGSSPAAANDEVQVFGIGITGDGSSSINSIDITLSDLTSATGLSAADISELRLYSSTDVVLDGGDTQIGNETSINIGSVTMVAAAGALQHVPPGRTLDGIDLLPVLRGTAKPIEGRAFGWRRRDWSVNANALRQEAYRLGDWKLLRSYR